MSRVRDLSAALSHITPALYPQPGGPVSLSFWPWNAPSCGHLAGQCCPLPSHGDGTSMACSTAQLSQADHISRILRRVRIVEGKPPREHQPQLIVQDLVLCSSLRAACVLTPLSPRALPVRQPPAHRGGPRPGSQVCGGQLYHLWPCKGVFHGQWWGRVPFHQETLTVAS